MTWTKLDDNIYDHPKMVRAGEDATDLYVRALVYSNKHLTDGRIEAEVLSALTRKRNAAASAAALVRVGAWDAHPDGGWVIHDFHSFNPTADEVRAKREEISAKRSAAGRKGGLRSGEARSNEANWKQTGEARGTNVDEATKQTPSNGEAHVEAPSRPVPSEGETTSLLRPSPPAPPPLALQPPEAEKPKRPAKPKADKPPATFTVAEALAAVASTAAGRFVAGSRETWAAPTMINVAAHARRFPDLATWRLVGEWIAAGGGGRGAKGAAWASSNAFLEAVAQATAWDEGGRYALVDERGFAVAPPVAKAEDPDPWVVAAAKAGVRL